MNKNLCLGVLILLAGFLSCKSDNQPTASIGYSDSNSVSSVGNGAIFFFNNYALIDSLGKRALDYGDTVAYEKLHDIYFAAGLAREFYYYALMMADQHNYNRACFETWQVMGSKNKNGIHERLATYYLLKSYEGNFEPAIETIEDKYGASKVPSSDEYLKTFYSNKER